MTNYEFMENKKAKAQELLSRTKDFYLKEFYNSVIECYNLKQGGMTLEYAEKKFGMR